MHYLHIPYDYYYSAIIIHINVYFIILMMHAKTVRFICFNCKMDIAFLTIIFQINNDNNVYICANMHILHSCYDIGVISYHTCPEITILIIHYCKMYLYSMCIHCMFNQTLQNIHNNKQYTHIQSAVREIIDNMHRIDSGMDYVTLEDHSSGLFSWM